MRALIFWAALSTLLSSVAHAQTAQPLATPHLSSDGARTSAVVGVGLGIERFGAPTLTFALAPTSSPLSQSSSSLVLTGRFDSSARSVGVGLGGQFVQSLNGTLFVREAVVVQPFLIAVDDVVGGVRGEVTAQIGFHLDRFDFAIGPRFIPVVAVAEGTDGRLGVDVVGAARFFVVDELALTVDLGAGSDFSHRNGIVAGSVLSGTAYLGVQWAPR